MENLPFMIDRSQRHSLTAQVEQGLRHAILSGAVAAGEGLPTLLEMAAQLGVSEIVVRRAVRRLSAEGLVKGRPRSGFLVCDTRRRPWRATVLYLHWSGPEMYYHSVLSATVGERLQNERVLMLQALLTAADAMREFAKVQTLLDTQPPTLVVLEGGADWLDRHLEQRRIPFLHMTYDAPSPLAAGHILLCGEAAMAAVAEHCRRCGVRTALLAMANGPSVSLPARLAAAGIEVETLPLEQAPELPSPAAVETGALRAFERWLAARPKLPDLIYFGDDFAARGGLQALATRGVRIPEDVQVVSWANRGLGPVFAKPLTRVEMDPMRHGEQVAEAILRQLDRDDDGPSAPTRLEPEFVVGETTRSAEPGARSTERGARSGGG